MNDESIRNKWDEFADMFDNVMQWFTAPSALTLIQSVDPRDVSEDALVIEVGCGAGGGSELCASIIKNTSKCNFQAFDLSPEMVKRTQFKLQNFAKTSANVASAQELPLADGKYSFLTMLKKP